jgi:hypothetical protein
MAKQGSTVLTDERREEIARHATAEAAAAPLPTEAQLAELYQALWAPSIQVETARVD